MTQATSTQIQLFARPNGWPTPADFRTVEVELGELADGEVRVKNEFLSVDPYMRGRMSAGRSYVAPYELGRTLTGGAVGTVVESAAPDIPVGSLVAHEYGWRDLTQARAKAFRVLQPLAGHPNSLYLGLLGMPGLTAYVGLTEVAGPLAGARVFISGAAGAVGTAAGQFARLLGAVQVIGSAGSAAKVELLRSRYGYDAAFNYKDGPVLDQLRAVAPDGIDVYFDNVGGDHLEAALAVINDHGRIAVCGAISRYNATAAEPGPRTITNVLMRRVTMRGFIVHEVTADHPELATEFATRAGEWLADGKLVYEETIVDGLDHTIEAFLDMLRGANTGKMIVRL